ncbi:DNA polymerase-like protein [Salipiger mucosus DSM 16094]|uniref:DNA polymerase-like protein n=1 Tax=Salipiger mucosus DSM 16094 TaxID=1123237 RepID=S9S9U7_9RHOB|nr:DNA polymerase-like protein [Salipiger mucosus DSM 16094]
MDRLDQALGAAPEPLSPAAAQGRIAVRLTLPEPIGLEADMLAALDRMLPRLCGLLRRRGRGLRTLRLEAHRTDDTMQWTNLSLARPSWEADRLWPLLRMKLPEFEAGFGIDMLRLEAVRHEHVQERTQTGHVEAGDQARRRMAGETLLADLLGRLGARIGMEAITRRHPGDSHIPEKGALTLAAAWSEPAPHWPPPPRPRPLSLFRPEPVQAPETPHPPARFRWRGREVVGTASEGPERIAPEWWLDEPDWRSGLRDYWQVSADTGERLWLFYAHGGTLSPGWFCHGIFA